MNVGKRENTVQFNNLRSIKILVAMPAGHVRDTFFTPEVVEKLEGLGEIVWNDSYAQYGNAELKEKLAGMDVCITGWGMGRLDREVLEGAANLKLVAHTGGSVAGIVSDFLYEKGIRVISGNWVFAECVAEGVIAYIMCALRELPYYSGIMQKGGWREGEFFNESLLDQSIGLVGFGAVAKYLVGLLKPFRSKIKVYDPYVKEEVLLGYGLERATLAEIFSGSKIISLHAPRTPDTYHMINRELLRQIPDGALFVNTSRGSLVDEEALADELGKGRFKAVLDVFETEPLPEGSRLRGLKNVMLIPHMAGPTIDRRKHTALAVVDDIENFSKGKPLRYEIGRSYALSMTQ